jgi:hypothetical protein
VIALASLDASTWASIATAVGTISLGLATFWLGWQTRNVAKTGDAELKLLGRQANAADSQSKAAEAALSASIRPLLLDVPRHTHREILTGPFGRGGLQPVDASVIYAVVSDSEVHLTVPVRNAGQGVALVTAAALTSIDAERVVRPVVTGGTPSAIAPREEDSVYFDDDDGPSNLRHLIEVGGDLVVEVAYSDAAGGQLAATRLYLIRSGQVGRSYRVRRTEPGVRPKWT